MDTLTIIEAGKTVSEFIEDLNNNFSDVTTAIKTLEQRKITMSTNSPSPTSGTNGDIWIVYEADN